MPIEVRPMVKEIEVVWIPKDHPFDVIATIRDGKLGLSQSIGHKIICGDLDGCIEFLTAVQKVIADTLTTK